MGRSKTNDDLIVIEGGILKKCDNSFMGQFVVLDDVTSIENNAFEDCEELKSVIIPASVVRIGKRVFLGCSGLMTSISVDASNPKYDSRDNCNAIIEKSSNKLIVGCMNTKVPKGVIRIGEWAFGGASQLKELNLPASVQAIEEYAFDKCYNFEHISLSEGITEIGEGAFFECCGLESIILPKTIKIIGKSCFFGCESLESIMIPASVESIKGLLFENCDNLQHIIVMEGNRFYDSRGNCNAIIEKAKDKLIMGCSNTVLPNTIKEIGKGAFMYTNIHKITIPENVEKIGRNVFASTQLSRIVVNRNNPTYDSMEDCNAIIETSTNRLLYGCKNTRIPKTVTLIEDMAFYSEFSLNL